MIDLDDLKKRMNEYKNSEEYVKRIQKLKLAKELKEKRIERINSLSDEEFHKLMKYLIQSNGERRVNECYNKNIEPMPTELLFLVMYASEKHGTDYSDKWQNDYHFPVQVIQYKGYEFFWMFGQGCYNAVFQNNEKIISL